MISSKEVIDLLAKHGIERTTILPEEWEDLQSSVGRRLPDELRQWLMLRNGLRLHGILFFGHGGACQKELGILRTIRFLSTRAHWDFTQLLPIATDGCGNFFLQDCVANYWPQRNAILYAEGAEDFGLAMAFSDIWHLVAWELQGEFGPETDLESPPPPGREVMDFDLRLRDYEEHARRQATEVEPPPPMLWAP